eukprot:CAMPEP_0202692340 /NCGR_PEP_ID=MMETSP1385-20130828/6749_1 /ASSEMBLY_ACC=CAM_ASM_000861 /TAXON_ID=933848 /ORGANISM="Elphidium margaritaceum" /LENGTH=30 /DNA_ID= /DNA_START= /DNA_END= /DNA_ORIENTATION=
MDVKPLGKTWALYSNKWPLWNGCIVPNDPS